MPLIVHDNFLTVACRQQFLTNAPVAMSRYHDIIELGVMTWCPGGHKPFARQVARRYFEPHAILLENLDSEAFYTHDVTPNSIILCLEKICP